MGFVIDCLGASREVGRSAFLVKTDKKIMLDYGIKIFDESGRAKFPLESANPDMVVLSHAHLDHSGCLPALYRNSKVRWYAPPPTRDICEVLWKDSMKIMGSELPYGKQHMGKAMKYWSPMLYNKPIRTGDTRIELHDAGHISGAAMIQLDYKGKRLLYSGDFKGGETYMHKGAAPVEDVDLLIMETTYAMREHPPRKKTETRLMQEIYETIDDGGNALLPSFALGRTQELIALLRNYDPELPVFVDGMGRELTKIYLKHPRYIKDPKTFRKAVRSVNLVESIVDKKKASNTPCAIVAGAGMLNGGTILNYLFHANSNSKIIFTGYCVEGTNGWLLQNKGYIMQDEQELEVDLPAEYLDLSAHAGRKDIMKLIERANPERIILVHGDRPQEFAEELKEKGYDALAPLPGERIEI